MSHISCGWVTSITKPTILEQLRDHVEASAESAGAASKTIDKLRVKPLLTIDEMGDLIRALEWKSIVRWREPETRSCAPSFYRDPC